MGPSGMILGKGQERTRKHSKSFLSFVCRLGERVGFVRLSRLAQAKLTARQGARDRRLAGVWDEFRNWMSEVSPPRCSLEWDRVTGRQGP
jgi:hypothetical protein